MVCIENTDKDPEHCNINFGEKYYIAKLSLFSAMVVEP